MTKRTLECVLMILALLMSLLSVSAFAAPAEKELPIMTSENVIINEEGSTLYNDGDTVINNFGIVYNNGGIVYNNAGTVYNNSGTVYNNGGVVYNNGAVVYNNGGIVHNNNEGLVHENTETAEAEPEVTEQAYIIRMKEEYGDRAVIEGLDARADGTFAIQPGTTATITPKDGFTITEAVTTTGACQIDEEGLITLSRVDRDGELTLRFQLAEPQVSPVEGCYGEEQTITIQAAAGAKILYTLDNSSPLKNGKVYEKPFELEESCVLKVAAVMGTTQSAVLEQVYVFPALDVPEFEEAEVGYETIEAEAIVVKNTGIKTVEIKSVKLESKDRSSFRLNTEKGGSVASGQRDEKTWTIAPKQGLKAGEYEADIVFTLENGSRLTKEIRFEVKK